MAQPAATSIQFFLGVGGQQTGPYSQTEVLQKIRSGEAPPDTLVWYEGLPDWQPIASISYLQGTGDPIEEPTAATKVSAGGFKPLSGDTLVNKTSYAPQSTTQSTFTPSKRAAAPAEEEMEPVFGGGGGSSSKGFKLDEKKKKQLAILGAVVGLAGAAYYFMGDDMPSIPGRGTAQTAETAASDAYPTDREGIVRKALSELLLKPDEAITKLVDIAKSDSKDNSGKEATQAVIDFLKQRQRFGEAGKFLMEAKRPLEAYKFFLMDPPAPVDAEAALFAAYQQPETPNRRDVLIDDVKLLLGPVNNYNLAVDRIRLLEKDFPGKPHPYGYYLKTTDQKITDLFQRVSFFFVQNLVNFIASELPQMNLVKRPLVEVKRDKLGKFRIIGTYKGEVVLNQDRLQGIRFTFWYFNEIWNIVETNVTGERQAFSKSEKKKHEVETSTPDEMLEILQTVFRTQFPKNSLHEAVTLSQSKDKNRNTVE